MAHYTRSCATTVLRQSAFIRVFHASGTEQYHYPSIIQAKDGTLHAVYSDHWLKPNLPVDPDGDPAAKTIKYVHFNEAWVRGE